MSSSTAVQERLSKRFELWDTDGNGQIDRSDFQSEATHIVAAFGESVDTPRGHAVADAFNQLWEIGRASCRERVFSSV